MLNSRAQDQESCTLAGPHHEVYSGVSEDATDALLIGRMRLLLAVSGLLAIFVDPEALGAIDTVTLSVFICYVGYSVVIYVCTTLKKPAFYGKAIHWLDVFWFALIILFTGGINSFYFLLFFFAILTSSFRWGLEEGARVTLASTSLFTATGLLLETENELTRLLLRTIFLLSLGYLSAHWGESKVRLKRRLAMLRDVSQLSNPRFGVDNTITSVLEKTQKFFKADCCIVIMRDKETGSHTLRSIKKTKPRTSVSASPINADAAAPFKAFSREHILVHALRRWKISDTPIGYLACDSGTNTWVHHPDKAADSLAELLEARSFISAPLSMRTEEGRIFVASSKSSLGKSDALFLAHIVAQAFPMIENIDLLDRMASEAASLERRRMAMDLHDTALQPYIGLKLALSAVRKKASEDNPLNVDLERLMAMAAQVIGDLRHYAGAIRKDMNEAEPALLAALRRHAAHIMKFYGIKIDIGMDGDLHMNDRLMAEVLQLVREGLSNICKHTVAQKGAVKLQCMSGRLRIRIENESGGEKAARFVPKSISERVAALGGNVAVINDPDGNTVVDIEIPT